MDNDTCEAIKPADMGWVLVRNTSKDRPRVAKFFLVNVERDDIMVEASSFLGDFEIAIHLVDGDAMIGPVPPIKGLPFVSCRALAKSNPKWDAVRTKILRQIAG